jgi:two-component system OmpR family response regulator
VTAVITAGRGPSPAGPPPANVVVLHWPAQADAVAELDAAGTARLLLVDPDADPPVSVDWLEDWVRLPADERDVAARMLSLTRRLDPTPERPYVDDVGRMFYRGNWAALSPIEARLASALADQFDAVVDERELGRVGWPVEDRDGSKHKITSLRVHLTRLRRRLAPLGLEVRAVRSQGFILQAAEGAPSSIPLRHGRRLVAAPPFPAATPA